MELEKKRLLGNIFLSFLSIIFFLSLIYVLQSFSYGLIMYTTIVIDFVLFIFIVYITCKTCRISMKYEKNSKLARSIPYLIFLSFMANITGLFRLSEITFLEHFIQLTVLTVFYGAFIYWVRKL